MANFYVTHHKYPDNPQLFTVNIDLVVKRTPEPGTIFSYGPRGEQFWEIYVATSGLDSNGDELPPFWADVITTESSIDDLVAEQVKALCALIDWTQQGDFSLGPDTRGPYLQEQYPASNETDVPITGTIRLVVKEPLPGSGMDIGTMYVKVNGVSITPTVHGHPYQYEISYSPKPIYEA